MKNFLLVAGLLLSAGGVNAGPFGLVGRRSPGAVQSTAQAAASGLWTAAQAAAYCASRGRIGHYGNPTGGYEGVGFSTVSADAAVRNCCFWGKRTPRDIGVCQGANGWFACVRYH